MRETTGSITPSGAALSLASLLEEDLLALT